MVDYRDYETDKPRWWKFKRSERDSDFVEKFFNTSPKFYVIISIIGMIWVVLWIWDGLRSVYQKLKGIRPKVENFISEQLKVFK